MSRGLGKDDLKGWSRYEITPVNGVNRPGGNDDGAPDDYVPDGHLGEPGLTLHLVVYPRGVHPDDRKNVMMSPMSPPPTQRWVERSIDSMLDVVRWGPR